MNKNDLRQLIQECISEVLDGNIASDGNIDPHRSSVNNMLKGFKYMLDELDVMGDYNKLTAVTPLMIYDGIPFTYIINLFGTLGSY